MKMRKLFALLVALLVVLSSSIFAAADEAEEPIDFDTVDWETVDLTAVHRQLLIGSTPQNYPPCSVPMVI